MMKMSTRAAEPACENCALLYLRDRQHEQEAVKVVLPNNGGTTLNPAREGGVLFVLGVPHGFWPRAPEPSFGKGKAWPGLLPRPAEGPMIRYHLSEALSEES